MLDPDGIANLNFLRFSFSSNNFLFYGKYISIDVERTPPVLANIYLATMSNGMSSGNLAKPS